MNWRPKGWQLALVVLVVCALALAAVSLFQAPRAIDDQHLKTVVGLVELHKLRFGRYPGSLEDLKNLGEWDRIAVKHVRYCVAVDGSAYFVGPLRSRSAPGHYPDEFWRGTGFRLDLGSSCP